MILAAAACADGTGPPPPELELAWQMEAYHALPEPGGLRDQHAGELRRCSAALNTYRAVKAFRHSRDWVSWGQQNPEAYELVTWVTDRRNAIGKHN